MTNTVYDQYQPGWTTSFGEFIDIDMVIDHQSHYQSFREIMNTKSWSSDERTGLLTNEVYIDCLLHSEVVSIMSKEVYHIKNVNIVFKLIESIYLLTNHVKSNFIILIPITVSVLLGIKTYCDHNVTFCCLPLSFWKEHYLILR